ncbi:MAG TPA: NAD(P)/FAD-dependent oxidoreductase [Planctomycetota bacterium]|nr:NAD(P)/FAD-dependent oxidoreductase [Planctomycetota bacterium]
MTAPPSWDVIVLGGGAAGLFCAAVAGARGRRVLVLERNERVGKKVLISGGGRANFTNRRVTADNFVSHNPDFARSALARYTPDDFLALVERHRIPWVERKHGQLFCRDSAKAITEMLLEECHRARVEIRTGCRVADVARLAAEAADAAPRFGVRLEGGEALACRSLVVATGGLSYERLGASDLGYRIARQHGLALVPPRPGLVPLLWTRAERPRWDELAGVATPARVECGGARFEEALLFTHGGLSGPAILQISNYWRLGESVRIDLLPGADLRDELLQRKARGDTVSAAAVLAERLPRRLAERLVPAPLAVRPLAQCAAADLAALAVAVQRFRFQPAEDAGYDKAEVTLGGVDTAELSSRTLEARRAPGLYFIGEVVDVTGWLGGYNFQWAWASAHAAGEAV